ncbi:MAG: peptidoglycan DD-metalloendopeptidase family protein [Candidatus Aminicenantes bacterium]|nr:peptidoglycan DD-metalloendopeptidase family protein [Candidatus Aminicenantes bacterium]
MAKKKFLSLIIVPHTKGTTKTITLSRRTSRLIFSVIIGFGVILAGFLVDYFSMNVTRARYRQLQSENQEQKKVIASYENSIRQLMAKIQAFESYARKLNVMAGLRSPEALKEVGVGSGEETNGFQVANPNWSADSSSSALSLSQIHLKAEQLEQNFGTLLSFFEQQRARLAQTPTIWPTVGFITSGFGWRIDPFTGKQTFHKGIDIATNLGNPVVATADGVVIETKNDRIGGKTIQISHGGGLSTLFYHLDKILVRPGQKVKRGDIIGLVGKTGKALGPHLHYEVQINGKSVNPLQYILEEE